ncbi:hypothetical protein LCGC14_2669730, partial [marine sediment metagenome]
ALSDNYEAKRQDGEILSYPVKGSTTIYKGAMIVDLNTGYASVGVDGSGNIFLGVAVEKIVNSGSDGAKRIRVYKTGVFQYNMPSAAQTDLDQQVYIRDDNTVDTTVTNSVKCGFIVDIVDSSTVKVQIDHDAQSQ